MASRYYQQGDRRAEGVRELFAAVAPRYDLINDLQSFGLHRIWKRRLVALAEIQWGERALDVCCGTGDIAFALAGVGAVVTGVDFSEPMLAIARRRALVRGEGTDEAAQDQTRQRTGARSRQRIMAPPRFEQGDALALGHGDAVFDVVTAGYGLRNLSDLDGGLREWARVTRSGGRLLVLDFAWPGNRAWRAVYAAHLHTVVPLLGRVFCGEAATHAYIVDSLRRYPGPAEIAARMEANGWRDVRWWGLLGGVMTIHRGFRGA